MKIEKSVLTVMALISVGLPFSAWSAENIDTAAQGATVIVDQLWSDTALPINWFMNDQGVTNNNSTGVGPGNISAADAAIQVTNAFNQWQTVTTAGISANYSGTTVVDDIGCDYVNLMTWADDIIPFDTPDFQDVIAIGFAFSYVGPDIVLDPVAGIANPANNRNLSEVSDAGLGCAPLANAAIYPDGSVLESGTIIDADMIWNPIQFDYDIAANASEDIVHIESIATHEVGHLLGVSHTSLAFAANDPATMFPFVDTTNVVLQNNIATLAADDEMAVGRSYPGTGFYPGGVGVATTGQITGWVRQADGSPAQGVRLWAYDASLPAGAATPPVYEAFSATTFDAESGVNAGDYSFRGIPPGDYYVCILPWENLIPGNGPDAPERYNSTTLNGSGHTGFMTECFDDAPSATNAPDFAEEDRLRQVSVSAGETTSSINFVTGQQAANIMLVMDRSGSMNLGLPAPLMGTKIEALRSAAHLFIDFMDLDGGHNVGLVQFESVVVPFAPSFNLQPIDLTSVGDAHTAIDSIMAGGLTNIIDGVNEGINQLVSGGSPNHRPLMLLFSDGRHNSPAGSDLNTIEGPLLANEVKLYSVGFGSDVDGAILAPIALNTGGLHIENPDVASDALRKHFLAIASSAADSTAIIDPYYELKHGQSVSLDVPVNSSEKDVTFTAFWDEQNENLFDITLTSPRGCTVQTRLNTHGVTVRKYHTHRLIKVTPQYRCGFFRDLTGTWKMNVRNIGDQHLAGINIAAYGNTTTHIFAEVTTTEKEETVLDVSIVAEGERVKRANVYADIILPVSSTGDSQEQDYAQDGRVDPIKPQAEERTLRISLNDRGNNGDEKAKDGIFSGRVPVDIIGTYPVHIYAQYIHDDQKGSRELISSYHFNGKYVIE
ncbi:VWA domain-containing protein [Marinibactrum halimedae]|uniref:VWFA domain-containing protein n=1 Tax=Marinibactrum halimedae TaxID=1444977 RepID=A0AA37WKM0_9GAMM|nr:VWA domain-containing protein [Marinibactrum halimedae]MCD9460674.1 VWA domain-containing protein [Marinibactrum halimedae]GLS24320.1 hypothetical protein GCM10007877_00310 [Marinibactrum halimedae]